MRYGLIGEKLGHSYSKIIHEALTSYQYDLIPLSKEEFITFMKQRDFNAINVTIPYKQAVIEFLDYIDDNARKIGAVNTVVNKDGKLYGYNTDAYGFEYTLSYHNINVCGKKSCCLGDGGTARTVMHVLSKLGATNPTVVSRTKKDHVITYEELRAQQSDIQIIVNTTPVGMYPNIDASPLDLTGFSSLEAVVDIIYNPLETLLIKQADCMGIQTASGLLMLVAQATKAIEHFIGKKITEDEMICVYQDLRKKLMD